MKAQTRHFTRTVTYLSLITGSMEKLCDGQITEVNERVILKSLWELFCCGSAQTPEQEFEIISIDRCVQYSIMPWWLST